MCRRATSHDFVGRSARAMLAFLKDAVYAEETARRPGLLQGIEPRAKIVGMLALLVLAMLVRALPALAVLYLVSLLLAVLSRLGLVFFLVRTWVFIPLFSLAVAIPALFSFVSPGHTVAVAGGLRVTDHGLRAVGFFVGRVVVSVSLTVLLSLTTRHAVLLKALRAFGVPRIFVMALGIGYRYVYLFVELVDNTYRAVRSRTGGRMHHRQGQRLVAWNIGQLWSRSYALNEQVYGAMTSRGFRGDSVTLEAARMRLRDWCWLAGTLAFCLLAFKVNG